MARPKQKKARKDYPQSGIKRGDLYWYVSIKTGPRSSRVMRQLEPFRQSQLTTSEFLGAYYDLGDELGQMTADRDLPEALNDIAQRIRELGEEQQEKLDNMPEGLQQGDTGQMIQERIDGCESWASDVESAASDLETKIEEIDAKDEDDLEYLEQADGEEDGPDEDAVAMAREKEVEEAAAAALEEAQGADPGIS